MTVQELKDVITDCPGDMKILVLGIDNHYGTVYSLEVCNGYKTKVITDEHACLVLETCGLRRYYE